MYLVQIEGYEMRFFKTEDEVLDFLHEVAEEMRARGVDCVSTWIYEMITYNSSNLYNRYPDIVVYIADENIKEIKNKY